MTGECEDCGGDVEAKNSAGHYRDKCEACLRAAVDAVERPDCEACDRRAVGPASDGRWLCEAHMADAYERE